MLRAISIMGETKEGTLLLPWEIFKYCGEPAQMYAFAVTLVAGMPEELLPEVHKLGWYTAIGELVPILPPPVQQRVI